MNKSASKEIKGILIYITVMEELSVKDSMGVKSANLEPIRLNFQTSLTV